VQGDRRVEPRFFAAPDYAFFVAQHERRHPRRKYILELVAYLGRYAHQSIRDVLSLSVSDMMALTAATERIIKEEAAAAKRG